MFSLRSDVLAAVMLKIQTSWDVVLHLGLCRSRHFKELWYHRILGQAVQEEFLDCLTFETSGTTRPMTHHYMSEDLNCQYVMVISGVNF